MSTEQSAISNRQSAILPEKALLEAGEVYGCRQTGITKGMFYAAVESGVLTGVLPAGRKKRHKYRRDEVMRVFGIADC